MRKTYLQIITMLIYLAQTASANPLSSMEFSEVSFNNPIQDYIKIQINFHPESPIQINIDKPLLEILPSQITTQKEIIIRFKSASNETKESPNTLEINTTEKGLTATTEQLTITTNNQITDYVCWQNSKIAQSEQKDLDELSALIPTLNCINSEEVKKDGIIKKNSNKWEISNPIKKSKTTKKTSTRKITINPKPISDIKNLEVKTQNINTPNKENHSNEILMAATTITLSAAILILTKTKAKDLP